jgi:hypothetical protein
MKHAIFFLSLLMLANKLDAQTNLYNSGQIFISNSTDTLFISGSLFNNSGAVLNNAGGNLFVIQDITNNEAAMTAGGGKLWTTGTAMQSFYGSNPFKTYNWIADNANNITLQNRVEVGDGTGGNLSFVNGQVNSGTSLQDVYFRANSTYTGYSDAKHIIGYCSKEGNTNFTYPIGNGTLKADLDIDNLSTSSVFQCKYFGAGYSSLAVTAPLVSVFDKEYWVLDRTSGTSGANITLKWNDARNPLNHSIPAGLRVGHFTGASWISEGGVGTGNTVTGSVTSIMVNSYSPFTFASEASVLPILLNSFDGYVNGACEVAIKWAANAEGSVKKYYLQKLVNNKWEIVYECLPKQSTVVSNYYFTDAKAFEGSNIYRVMSENINGSVVYTASKNINVSCGKKQIQVYPTITSDAVTVSIPLNFSNSTLTVVNGGGQVVFENNKLQPGKQQLNLKEFAAGVYTIIVKDGDGVSSFRIIKQ